MSDFTVILNGPELDAEARRARGLRAKEILENAGWVFEEMVGETVRQWLAATTPEAREQWHLTAMVARTIASDLKSIVDRHLAEEKTLERNKPRNPDDHA